MNRHNNRTLDLSQPMRLSNLSSGAKLELIVLSKSPSVVSVALQLPESESEGIPNSRLIDKFPSTTTLWLVLRKFESGAAGGETASRRFNFTARGKPQTDSGDTGSGRIYHEAPVIQVMGRELASFQDFQKSLGQLGLNAGSVLLRLSFSITQNPLEVAMTKTEEYFASIEAQPGDGAHGAHASSLSTGESVPAVEEAILPEGDADMPSPEPKSPRVDDETMEPVPQKPSTQEANAEPQPTSITPSLPTDSTITGPNQRPISVLAPPSSNTPHASRQAYNDDDYEPTIDHARQHLSRLKTHGQNKRLPTDAEVAEKEKAESQKRAQVTEVEIKLRFPDQTQVLATFTNLDTALTLYDHAKHLVIDENEPFLLNFTSAKGPITIPRNSTAKLISGLGMTGKVLVNFIWDGGQVPRGGKVLKPEFAEKAREIEVREPQGVEVDAKPAQGGNVLGKEERGKERKGGVPKWLKLPGKK